MDQPIACTLTTADYRERTSSLAALADRALLGREPTEGGERLTFRRDDEVARELEAAIAAEASCCAFLAFELERHDDHLALEIVGPEDARPVIAALFALAA